MAITDTASTAHDNPLFRGFWTRPETEINAALDAMRAAGPIPFYSEEIDENGLIPPGPGSWVFTRHADVLHISKNPQLFSSASGITVLDSPPEFNEYFSSMIAMDDPRHAKLRKIVSAGFTPRMLKRLEDSVQSVAATIVDDISERTTVDFVVDVAAALPLKIVCDLMGIPDSHYEFVFDQSNVILGAGDPEYVPESSDVLTAILEAGGNLSALMEDVAKAKEGGDGTDLTSVLVNADLEDDRLTGQDLASFFILLVVAGNETTRNAISWGLHHLTENPDQKALWLADIEGVGPKAVEEIVRVASPVTYMRRTATADTLIDGQKIAEGDKVCMFYYAANRDPAVFDDPHRFLVTRDPNDHIGFGGPGPHFCLGAHLARREIMVMFRELLTRLPDIHATSTPVPLASSFIHGVKHLEATFTPVG